MGMEITPLLPPYLSHSKCTGDMHSHTHTHTHTHTTHTHTITGGSCAKGWRLGIIYLITGMKITENDKIEDYWGLGSSDRSPESWCLKSWWVCQVKTLLLGPLVNRSHIRLLFLPYS
jgi:hypothetical protein